MAYPKMSINFTQHDIEQMMDAAVSNDDTPVHYWTLETNNGDKIDIEVTVGEDEE